MKNKYKLICCIIAFTFLISILCVPAMAYQISNIMAGDTETDIPVYNESSSVVSETVSYLSTDTEVISITTDTPTSSITATDSDIYSSTVVSSDTDTSTTTDIFTTDTESTTDTLTDTEIIGDITDTETTESNTSSEEESYTPPYQGDIYTPLYSTVDDNTRSVITGDNWSNISIAIDDGDEAAGKVNLNGNNKGDFSFIKDNKPNSGKSTLYYWLAGGISCLVVGLCGIAFVAVTMMEKNKRMKLAAERKSKSKLASGETAEFKLPRDRDK